MDFVVTERHEEIFLVRLNRPRQRNALNRQSLIELGAVIDSALNDDAIRAVVLTGSEQAFSAGQDLKEPESSDYIELINATFDRLETLPKPTVAAIDGWCIAGGLELALCCDIRVCADSVKIGDWHAKINSIGGAGATVRLVRTIGLPRAKELVFSGAALDAKTARDIGLVSHVYESGALVGSAIAFAKLLCVGSAITVSCAKKSMNAAADLPLDQAMALSLECQSAVRKAHSEYTDRFAARNEQPQKS